MRLRLIADRHYWESRARLKALQDSAHQKAHGDCPFIHSELIPAGRISPPHRSGPDNERIVGPAALINRERN